MEIVLFTRILDQVETVILMLTPLETYKHEAFLSASLTLARKILREDGWKEITDERADSELHNNSDYAQYQIYFFEK